jgi:8-oxo-dGTP pyrophosphatase MutT (NUDIX family)
VEGIGASISTISNALSLATTGDVGSQSELDRFLAGHAALTVESASWGYMGLRVAAYVTDQIPPLRLVTSARCIVTKGAEVLVHRDRTGIHIWPGGRHNPPESLVGTARREVLEETGWRIGEPTYLGFVHYRHLTPKPLDYSYPYPDFVQVVFSAEGLEHVPHLRFEDGFEVDSTFTPIALATALNLSAGERLYLREVSKGRS